MKLRLLTFASLSISIAVCIAPRADEPRLGLDPKTIQPSELGSKPSYPLVREGGYVLLEIWPAVKEITLSAFFLDDSDGRSRKLCETVKKSLDHEAEIRAREQKKTFTSFRIA